MLMDFSDVSIKRDRRDFLPLALLALSGIGWWSSISTARDAMPMMGMGGAMVAMSLTAFLIAWVAMMAAMMLPSILPVVLLYERAADRGTVAPVPFFLAGYAVVWSVVGLPAYFIWRQLNQPLSQATPTAGRIAGTVLIGAAVYQITPLKSVCLRHCRSPMNFFMQHAKNLRHRTGALVLGSRHGLYCLGCCWMLMAVLVAFGTMQIGWMVGVAVVIFLERVTPFGEKIAQIVGVAFLSLGVWLLVAPTTVGIFT